MGILDWSILLLIGVCVGVVHLIYMKLNYPNTTPWRIALFLVPFLSIGGFGFILLYGEADLVAIAVGIIVGAGGAGLWSAFVLPAMIQTVFPRIEDDKN